MLAAVGAALGALVGAGLVGSPALAVFLAMLGALVGGLVGVVVAVALGLRPEVTPVDRAVSALCERGVVPHDLPEVEGVQRVRELALVQERQIAVEANLRNELQEIARRELRERAKFQAELTAARKEGGAGANEAFLMRMSHELRTPLNAILGYADLLAEELEGDDLRQDAVRIRQAGRHLLGLVTAVLDLTQMQSGRHEVEPEPIDFQALVEEVVDGVRPVAAANGNTIEVAIEADEQAWLDRRMVQSILFNLVHNAAKYTKNGTVTVRVVVAIDCEIFVGDTGIGMTDRQLEEAFVPFGQADISSTRAYDGTGLGLAVCRGFAEAMGGGLSVDTAIGEGARITVRLPRRVKPRLWTDEEGSEEKTMIMR